MDWAREGSLKVVKYAKNLERAFAREDLDGLVTSLRKISLKGRRRG